MQSWLGRHGQGEVYNALNTQEGSGSHHTVMAREGVQCDEYTRGEGVTPCSHGRNEVYNALNTQEGRGSHHVAQAVMTGADVQGAAYVAPYSHGQGRCTIMAREGVQCAEYTRGEGVTPCSHGTRCTMR